MEELTIEMCYGTACYLLGAAEFGAVTELLPENVRDRVKIGIRPCLGVCEDSRLGGAPYVRVGDELIAQATTEKIVDRVKDLLKC